MKTKSIAIIATVILTSTLLVFGGCGVVNDEPTPEVNADTLVQHGWMHYDNGDFEAARAAFDSVFFFTVDNPQAYIGLAWSYVQLGQYKDAVPLFSLAMVADPNYAKPLVTPVVDEIDTGRLDTVVYGADTVIYYEIPLKNGPVTTVKKVMSGFTEIPIYWISDSSVAVLESPDITSDEFKVTYDYATPENPDLNIEIAPTVGLGLLTANYAMEDYTEAIGGGKAAVIYGGEEFVFEHYPNVDARGVKIALASAFLRAGYFKNVVELLEELDEDFDFPNSLNPYDVNNFNLLLEELAKLTSGG